MTNFVGSTPDSLKPDPKEAPWTITFADDRPPITVSFGDNEFQVTLAAKRLSRGDEKQSDLDITATYRLVSSEPVKAVRQGSVKISVQKSGQQIPRQEVLKRRFNKMFREELAGPVLTPTGNFARLGQLVPISWSCKDGWMVLAWRRMPLPPHPPATKTGNKPVAGT